MRRAGWLVAIEGIDGTGKSTLQRGLARRLRGQGWRVGTWREPRRRGLGRAAQRLAREDPVGAAIHFTLDRLLAREELELQLRRSDVVLSDRSFYSTLAYQGSAVGPGLRRRLTALQRAVARVPDRVLWLELSPRQALERVGRRGAGRSPLERLVPLRRADRAYRALARGRGWRTLDARRPPDEIAAEAARGIGQDLRRRAS